MAHYLDFVAGLGGSHFASQPLFPLILPPCNSPHPTPCRLPAHHSSSSRAQTFELPDCKPTTIPSRSRIYLQPLSLAVISSSPVSQYPRHVPQTNSTASLSFPICRSHALLEFSRPSSQLPPVILSHQNPWGNAPRSQVSLSLQVEVTSLYLKLTPHPTLHPHPHPPRPRAISLSFSCKTSLSPPSSGASRVSSSH